MVECPSEDLIQDYLRAGLAPDIAASVVEHVSQCDSCRALVALAATNATPTEADGRPLSPVATPWEAGARLGRYEVIERLGGGGMGIVLAAYDPKLERKLALKLLRPDLSAGSEAKARLVREAQALAQLSHPNVIAIYDVGETEDEVFLAMELVDGVTLSAWLRERPRSWREIVEVMTQAGRGLAAAHAARLVHRDFKPDNVLIGRDGRVRVVDFGLVRVGDESPPTVAPPALDDGKLSLTTPLTLPNSVVGTPAYMAPEQLRDRPADARTDQFSFCVSLYEALYGVRPFPGKTLGEQAKLLFAGKVPPPPRGSQVPAWLYQLLLRGMRVDPEARFPSLAALLDEMERQQRGRRRLVLAAAAVALVAVGLGAHTLQARRDRLCSGASERLRGRWDPSQRAAVRTAFHGSGLAWADDAAGRVIAALDDYTQRWAAMRTDACEATRVRGEQSAELLDLRMQCLDTRLTEVETLAQLLAHADRPLVDRALGATSKLTPLSSCADVALLRAPMPPPSETVRQQAATLRARLAQVETLRNAGKLKDGRARLDETVAQARALGYAPVEAEALLLDGTFDGHPPDQAAARRTLDDAVMAAERGRATEIEVRAWSALVYNLTLMQRYDEAERAAQHAASILAGIGGSPRLEAALDNNRGILASKLQKLDDAIAFYRKSSELRERLFGADSPILVNSISNLSYAYQLKGDPETARALQERAVAISEKAYGPTHPFTAGIYANLAGTLETLHRLPEARSYAERALGLLENAYGHDSAEVRVALVNLGNIEGDIGDGEKAVAHLQRALAIDERIKPDGPNVSGDLTNLGYALLQLGRLAEAQPLFERALALRTKVAPDGPMIAAPLQGLAETLFLRGQAHEAVAPFERALALHEKNEGAHSLLLVEPLTELAEVELALRRPDEARKLVDRAEAVVQAAHEPARNEAAEVKFARAKLELAPAKARALATEARETFVALVNKKRADDVTAWLEKHGR